jgi:Lar family restriction alleviation protein
MSTDRPMTDSAPLPSFKPCPHCGGTNILVQEHGEGRVSANWWEAACFDCGQIGNTEAEAVAAWNKRAQEARRLSPLSEEQIGAIYLKWDATPGVSFADLARAIEAAHGIKG